MYDSLRSPMGIELPIKNERHKLRTSSYNNVNPLPLIVHVISKRSKFRNYLYRFSVVGTWGTTELPVVHYQSVEILIT